MDDITQKVYNHMKSLSSKHGFLPTIRQTAEQLNLEIQDVENAINKLQQLGKAVVTDIPAKSIIELVD